MRPAIGFVAFLILAWALACGGGGLPTATVVVADGEGERAELTVELARTAAERGLGLSHRDELPQDGGMLFVFPEDTETAFWMKDTTIPLSIAFIAGDGAILVIQDMQPLSMELHRPPGPYRYALEVNRGWFERNGFAAGDRVEIPASVAGAGTGD